MLNISLFNVALVFYAMGTLHYVVYLLFQREVLSRVGYWLVVAGFASHSLFFLARLATAGYYPITNLFEAVSFFAWAVVLFFLLYEGKYRLRILGAFILPIPLVMLVSAAMLKKDIDPLMPALKSYWLFFHTTFAFLGDAAFVITFAGGIMYLLQERQLKSRQPGTFYHRLPSLEVLDRLNYHSLTIGFACLTLGIITGAVWAEVAWGSYWSWDPKETWSLITWFIYAALLHARLTVGWRGRKAAYLSIIGFAAILFTFFGVNLLLGGLHAYTPVGGTP